LNISRRPNVIVFFTDQQRWDTVGAHGNTLDLTPNFDRLARTGTFVANSFTCQPVCGPARSVFQTGRYPTVTGCYRNDIPLPKGERTLAHHFAAGGYDTAYIGKWHLGSAEPVNQDERGGYRYWLASNILEFTSGPFDTVVHDNDGNAVKLPGYRVDALTDAAIRYIASRGDDPFFLFLSFLEPHHQNQTDNYPAPLGYEERIARKLALPGDLAALGGSTAQHFPGYLGMVARLDEAFGRLVEALYSLGLLENTIILFTSDHGCHFKTRNNEYKRSCHEASIRVPTLLHGPGFEQVGAYDGLVSLVDLAPTLLDAAGLAVPNAMQGRSLVQTLRGQQAPRDDVFIQISEHHVGRALRTRQWKYEIEAPGKDGWNDSGSDFYAEARLYDLQEDPNELVNLIGSPAHAEMRARLRNRLLALMEEAGESRPDILPVEHETWHELRLSEN
jgi:arylsulfatase A-like enzyme